MKNPIPEDWDGESWKRYCVCWPDSPLWTGLLLGLLSYFQRGRAWDEKTGIITDAQVIGREILEANYPLQEVALSCQEAQELTRAVIILFHAITGQDFDGPLELPNSAYLNGLWEFHQTGLANRIGPAVPQNDIATISGRLTAIEQAIEEMKTALVAGAATGEDLEDDLANVWKQIEGVVEILGGTPAPAPDPL
jgi:hypothetical protein